MKIFTLVLLPAIIVSLSACGTKTVSKTQSSTTAINTAVNISPVANSSDVAKNKGTIADISKVCHSMFQNASTINDPTILSKDPSFVEDAKTVGQSVINLIIDKNIPTNLKEASTQYYQDWVDGNAAMVQGKILVPTKDHIQHTIAVKTICGKYWN